MSVVLKRCIYMLVVEFGIGMVIITILIIFFSFRLFPFLFLFLRSLNVYVVEMDVL